MAEPTFDLVVLGGTCVTPRGTVQTDVGVRDGRIAAFGSLGDSRAAQAIDAAGLHVLPGVIDSQVHFREPGGTHKEDLATGTRAAVLGGITAVFEMPNTHPATVDRAALEDKLERANGRAHCDHAFFVGASGKNAEALPELEAHTGCCGVKVFMGSSTGSLLVATDDAVERVLRHGNRRVAIHAEDEGRLEERKAELDENPWVGMHPVWRDELTALMATQRVLALARKTGRRVHVLHVTTDQEMELLAAHKDVATVECTPQHLTLAAPGCYETLGTLAQMNPPIRGERQRDALWRAVHAGVVDVIGSDHAPHTHEEKQRAYPESPSGMPGVQTLLPIMLQHVHENRLALEHLVDLVCAGPARIYGAVRKGRLSVGYDGDLTLVDLSARRTISNSWIASRCGWTPFDGTVVNGWPIYTVVRGHVVMREDEIIGEPLGRPVSFLETMPAG